VFPLVTSKDSLGDRRGLFQKESIGCQVLRIIHAVRSRVYGKKLVICTAIMSMIKITNDDMTTAEFAAFPTP
jgi:hypothetical protein